jgi:nucleoside-diphosphate-sugar epimerase
VLRAAFDADVRRVVITSSSAAVRNLGAPAPSLPLTEGDWADLGNPKLQTVERLLNGVCRAKTWHWPLTSRPSGLTLRCGIR